MWLIAPHGDRHPAPAPLPTQLKPKGCQRNNMHTDTPSIIHAQGGKGLGTHHPLYMLRAGSGTGWDWMEWEQGPWQHRLCPQGMGNPGGPCPGICTLGRDSLHTEHPHQRRSRQVQRMQTCITEMEKHHRARRADEKVESKSVSRLWGQLGGQRNRAEGRGALGENKRGETQSAGEKLQIQEKERESR